MSSVYIRHQADNLQSSAHGILHIYGYMHVNLTLCQTPKQAAVKVFFAVLQDYVFKRQEICTVPAPYAHAWNKLAVLPQAHYGNHDRQLSAYRQQLV